ncbi:MAG TPA: biopolymer transporter ExbD [bacterium]|nr:biopolymer transporter ExbD [bacterium]HPJ73107.1 biopolymer transporter ExbD [bacterium]HPQ65254.1 biopolymer transporter ExbD [bacterium]
MNRRRRRNRIVINITSMIDIILLLLIFFMVTATFTDENGLSIDLPTASAAHAERERTLELSISSGGEMFLNREPVDRASLPGLLAGYAATLESPALVLKADRTLPYGLVVELMDLSRQAGLKKIVALTRSGGETAGGGE